MIKKLTYYICIFFLLFNYGFGSIDTVETSVSNSNISSSNSQTGSANTLSDIILTPITAITTGVVSIVMIPVGAVSGLIKGTTISPMVFDNGEHHKGDSTIVKAVVVPIMAIGLAAGGAVYMATTLPIETLMK